MKRNPAFSYSAPSYKGALLGCRFPLFKETPELAETSGF
jgi:hypothetical protein